MNFNIFELNFDQSRTCSLNKSSIYRCLNEEMIKLLLIRINKNWTRKLRNKF